MSIDESLGLIDVTDLSDLSGGRDGTASELISILIEKSNEQEVPECPKCNSRMAYRKAGKGKNKGKVFWGCTKFPACRGTREIED